MKIDKIIKQFIEDENYRVSNTGVIYSRYSAQGHKTEAWREISLINKRGYLFIKYKKHNLPIHRVVVVAYLGSIPFGFQINHKDGCPRNNQLSNLEIASQSENNYHRFRTLGYPPVRGHKKINFEIADQIREDHFLHGLSNSKLRAKYGLSKASISYILNDITWK